MPFSDYSQVSPILHEVLKLNPKTILDVGCGLGIYGSLCRIYLEGDNLYDRINLTWNKKENWKIKIDCIEGFEKYITELHRFVYNDIVIGDALKTLNGFKNKTYDLILAIDILEHFEKQDGITFIQEIKRVGKNIIIATPLEFIKQTVPENPLEDHRSNWRPEDLQSHNFTIVKDKPSLIGIHCSTDLYDQPSQPKDDITFRLYQDGDEHGIVKLFKEIFNREMTIEEWRWKYTGQGNKKVYSSVAVNETNDVIAHYGGIPHRMIYHGKEVYGLSIGDVMVHPKFRSFKVFKKMAALVPNEAAIDGFILGYGFPNERALQLPEKLGLYEKIEDVFEANKEVRFHKNMNRLLYKFFPMSYDDRRINKLWESVKDTFGLSVVRDRECLQWRYQKHPFFSYELWGLRKRWSSRLQGLAVLRKEEEKMLIIDFVCTGSMLNPLFQKIENYAFTIGEKKLSLWHPEYLTDKLTELGFSINKTVTCIPRTTHEKGLKKEDLKGKFFYTMGDTDFL